MTVACKEVMMLNFHKSSTWQWDRVTAMPPPPLRKWENILNTWAWKIRIICFLFCICGRLLLLDVYKLQYWCVWLGRRLFKWLEFFSQFGLIACFPPLHCTLAIYESKHPHQTKKVPKYYNTLARILHKSHSSFFLGQSRESLLLHWAASNMFGTCYYFLSRVMEFQWKFVTCDGRAKF